MRNLQPALTLDQVYRQAPSVFAEHAWTEVSDRYEFIPTVHVVEQLLKEGFEITKAQQSRTRIPGKQEFTKHLLRFRQKGVDLLKVGDEVPEIVLINSHDRTSAYKLHAGLFRLVCSNGLVIASAEFDKIAVRHQGNVAGEVIEGSYRIIKEFPIVQAKVAQFKEIALSDLEQQVFASAALELRDSTVRVEPEEILRPRRFDDLKNDLWTVFNRIQENLLKGGIRGTAESGRTRRTNAVKAVDADVKLNRALWQLQEAMAELKA